MELPLFPEEPVRNALEGKYRAWKATHGAVYALFEKFAVQMMGQGRRCGVKALAERVRWEVRTTWGADGDGYKMNNNFTAYIARDLIGTYPALDALIETRAVREDEP